ncbi:MAG: hypothetical protein L6W00_20015 [Lentisphaeria bacterium]|nr:MAG: hypothetical protein L6W00_20015 [Lentisphaeria bacterium]
MYRKRYRCRHGISPLRWPENGNPYRWSFFPPHRRCRECGRLLQPEQIRVTLTIFAPDDRQLKRPMELEVSDLKLSGPDTIVLSADFGKVVRDKLFETPPPSPSNAFDGRSCGRHRQGTPLWHWPTRCSHRNSG